MMLGSFGFAIALGASLAGEAAARLTVVDPGANGMTVGFEEGMNAYVSAYSYLGILAMVAGFGVLMISPTLYSRMHLPGHDANS